MKEKTAAALAAALMIPILFGGCGKKENEAETAAAAESVPAEQETASSEKTSDAADEAGTDAVSILVPEEAAGVIRSLGEKFAAKEGTGDDTGIRVLTYDGFSDLGEVLQQKDADLFILEADRLPSLVNAGLVSAVDSVNEETLSGAEESAIEAARVGDVVYARPLAIDNAAILYYDSSVISDPTDLDSILADCEAAGRKFYFEMDSGWYQETFFGGAGCTIDYATDADGRYIGCTCDYASEAGLCALRAMLEIADSESFVNASEAGNVSDMGALIGNVLDAPLVKDKLGDTYACMKLPKFRAGEGTYAQMSGFISYRMLGMKEIEDPSRKAEAEAFAEYLTSREAELLSYRESGWIPACSEALRSELVQSDEAAAALTLQMQYDKPLITAPSEYWALATGLGDEINIGAVTADSDDDTLLGVLQHFEDACAGYCD